MEIRLLEGIVKTEKREWSENGPHEMMEMLQLKSMTMRSEQVTEVGWRVRFLQERSTRN